MADNHQKQFRTYFTSIADLLGLPATKFIHSVDAVRSIWNKAKSEKLREEENRIRNKGVHRRLIRDLYSSTGSSSPLQQYTILIGNQRYPSTIFTTSQRVRLSIPLAKLKNEFVSSAPIPQYDKKLKKHMEKQAPVLANKLELLGARFWDQDIYRLISDPFVGDTPRLSFSLTRFLHYLFTAGLLEDELFGQLISHENDISVLLKEQENTLPLRKGLLPSRNSLHQVSERLSTGGIACILAMARGEPYNDYCIPLQVRSQAVAEGRGVYTGSIQAWHQPNIGDYENEASLYWTVLRELYEEIYGGEEIVKETAHLRHNWYLQECPGVSYVHNNPDKVTLELLGVGINALLGTYDCAILLAIHDTSYWDTYSNSIIRGWEAEKWKTISTKEIMPPIKEIFNGGWFDQGMFGLTQGLLRLRDLDEKRVTELDISFVLD